jgi:mannonate dehydratase
MSPTRRNLLLGLGAGAVGLAGLRILGPRALRVGPVRRLAELSAEARALVATALAGVALERVVDLHVHVAGLGGAGSGCWVNPRLSSPWRPLERLRFELYLGAAGVEEDEGADARYVARLAELVAAAPPGPRLLLFAFDLFVDEDGLEDRARSMFHVPDEYVCRLARADARFLAAASVHPFRPDALERLARARELGAVAVKWLPNVMGIDPLAPRCRPFYQALRALDLPLLVHTGEEKAVWVEGGQELGNPLRLRAALEEGVTVVALHAASLGSARDLDRAGEPRTASFALFERLLAEVGPGGTLYGEISALAQINREAAVLSALLEGRVPHARLLNGSDYPLVAIDPLTSLGRLARAGLLDPAERPALRELFLANPLLFDLVLKRRLRREGAEGRAAFAPEVFETARLFDKL